MRRAFYALVVIAVLALGLVCCWLGSKQDPKQPHEIPSAAARNVDPIPEATEASPTPAATSRDAGIDAGRLIVDQEPLIVQLRVLATRNPRLAESLAREDRQRSPNSPEADERDMILVASVYNQRDISGARIEAYYYLTKHPQGHFIDYVSTLTRLKPPSVRAVR